MHCKGRSTVGLPATTEAIAEYAAVPVRIEEIPNKGDPLTDRGRQLIPKFFHDSANAFGLAAPVPQRNLVPTFYQLADQPPTFLPTGRDVVKHRLVVGAIAHHL